MKIEYNIYDALRLSIHKLYRAHCSLVNLMRWTKIDNRELYSYLSWLIDCTEVIFRNVYVIRRPIIPTYIINVSLVQCVYADAPTICSLVLAGPAIWNCSKSSLTWHMSVKEEKYCKGLHLKNRTVIRGMADRLMFTCIHFLYRIGEVLCSGCSSVWRIFLIPNPCTVFRYWSSGWGSVSKHTTHSEAIQKIKITTPLHVIHSINYTIYWMHQSFKT